MRVCTHRKTNLLCSEVTQSLLLKDPEFTGLAPYLRALPMEEPIVMSLEASGAHEVCIHSMDYQLNPAPWGIVETLSTCVCC